MNLFAFLFPDADAKLDQILSQIKQERSQMSEISDRTIASLAKITAADDAVEALIKNLTDAVRASGTTDPAVIAALDSIDSRTDQLVAATLAGTPAAPAG